MGKIDNKKIGLAIKMQRIIKGIGQTELAEYLGISQTHLSNVENGRCMLSLKQLLKIKDFFKCTLDEIVDPDNYNKTQAQEHKYKIYKLVRYYD